MQGTLLLRVNMFNAYRLYDVLHHVYFTCVLTCFHLHVFIMCSAFGQGLSVCPFFGTWRVAYCTWFIKVAPHPVSNKTFVRLKCFSL